MTNGALISLLANRREEEQAVVEAAIHELEDKNRKTDAQNPADKD